MLSNFEYQPPIMQNQNCFTSLYQNHIQNINNNHPYPQINQQVQSQNYFRNQARQSRKKDTIVQSEELKNHLRDKGEIKSIFLKEKKRRRKYFFLCATFDL